MDTMSQSENPYAENHNPFQAPESPFDAGDLADTNDEAIRRAHLSHEASVKSVGTLYLIGGVLCVIGAIALSFSPGGFGGGANVDGGMIMLFGAIGVVQSVTAFGLRGLHGWARIPTGLLSGIGLLGFPIGTIVNGYILYITFSAKGSMVFSDEYHRIMEQTPHIKYKTSIIVKIFLGLLLGLIGLGILAALLGA
jgi:hypothetical protein